MSGRRIIKVAILAAVLMSLMAVTAFAVGKYINSPDQAVKIARQELVKMQELGIISSEIVMNDEVDRVIELEESEDNAFYPGRLFKHRYHIGSWGEKYTVNLQVDTAEGIIQTLTIEAAADETDEKLEGREFEGEHPNPYYYNNFDDIINPDITIDEFCTLLAEYWGFSGYTLSGTVDYAYQYDTPVPDGDALLSSICDEAYLTVYFEGDQEGVPMYVELMRFPGIMCLIIGTNHAVG